MPPIECNLWEHDFIFINTEWIEYQQFGEIIKRPKHIHRCKKCFKIKYSFEIED